jgi:hypothetical protein
MGAFLDWRHIMIDDFLDIVAGGFTLFFMIISMLVGIALAMLALGAVLKLGMTLWNWVF